MFESYDELDTRARIALESHLQMCRGCEQFRVSLNETQQVLDQWAEIDRPIDIEALHGAILP